MRASSEREFPFREFLRERNFLGEDSYERTSFCEKLFERDFPVETYFQIAKIKAIAVVRPLAFGQIVFVPSAVLVALLGRGICKEGEVVLVDCIQEVRFVRLAWLGSFCCLD